MAFDPEGLVSVTGNSNWDCIGSPVGLQLVHSINSINPSATRCFPLGTLLGMRKVRCRNLLGHWLEVDSIAIDRKISV
jgi:hypothetical protein